MQLLDVAWEPGSWDLARREAPPFIRPGSTAQELIECLGAFGNIPVSIDGQAPVVAEVPRDRGTGQARQPAAGGLPIGSQ